MDIYDIIVIGGGPAGLAAAIYGGRAAAKIAVIESGMPGGQILLTNDIENYPGVTDGESGMSLMQRFEQSAKHFGAAFIRDTVSALELSGSVKTVRGAKGEYRAKTVIIATGAKPRLLGVPGETEFTGRGVSYCATCDGAFFRGKEVFVAGGGDSAVEEAIYLTRFARQVTVIHRRDQLRASQNIQKRAFSNDKISFIWDSVVTELYGDSLLRGARIKNVKTGEISSVAGADGDNIGFFVFVGRVPISELFRGTVAMDENGFLLTDEEMRTGLPGVFAAGDIRKKLLRQVLTAASDGAVAAVAASRYIEETF